MAQENQQNRPAEDPAQTSQTQQPVEPQQTPEVQAQPPAAPQQVETQQPAEAQAPAEAQQQPAEKCKCPELNIAEWDKQKKQIEKTFYKTFSPRILNYPFSYVIDADRASRGAKAKNYQVPESPMVLDTGGMFWGELMVEVTGADTSDSSVVDFAGKELYTKTTTDTKSIKNEMEGLKAEMGVEPSEVYYWRVTCPKCDTDKEIKAIVIAVVPQAQQPQPPAEPAQPVPPAEPQPPAEPIQPEQPAEPQQPTEPIQPEQPAEPAQPEQPAEPPQPEQPAEPEQPVEPQPPQPEQPAEEPKQQPPQ